MAYWAHYAGRVYDEDEVNMLKEAADKFWLTHGEYTDKFEAEISDFIGIKHVHAVNSGSSANLLALAALQLKPGDEVITTAANFPTTVAPIVQYGLVPVFVDIDEDNLNANVEQIDKAISPKTKAIFLAHTLGNPFNIVRIKEICDKYDLWLIEDCCDAFGSGYYFDQLKHVGIVGDIATLSFYPAHLITTGEGGAVFTNDSDLSKVVVSLRDWGRDCHCQTGEDNACGKRFAGKFGSLPEGYDHKYVYSHFGYNLKMTDLQGAIGCAQMKKITKFINSRIDNWERMYRNLQDLEDYFTIINREEEACPFGFMMVLTKGDRTDFQKWMDNQGVQSRLLFAGNILKQPCIKHVPYYRSYDLSCTDMVMENGIWFGVYPGLSYDKIDKVCDLIRRYFDEKETVVGQTKERKYV